MRRKDREVTGLKEICEIINSCKVFRIAMSVKNIPYIVPLNFGYKLQNNNFEFYFHCAKEGKKLDMLKQNNLVCFEMDGNHNLITAKSPCGYGYNYKSIIGNGKVIFVDNAVEKIDCLNCLMKHQTDQEFSFTKEQVEAVIVCKIEVIDIFAKQCI